MNSATKDSVRVETRQNSQNVITDSGYPFNFMPGVDYGMKSR